MTVTVPRMQRLPWLAIETVVELINECSTPARAAAGETETPMPALSVLGDLGKDPARCRHAADELHAVFTDESGPAAALNHLLAATDVRPRLDERGKPTWVVADGRVALLAAATVSLMAWVTTNGVDRLGICSAHRCADVFVDTSRAATRRYCSSTCLNRARVARWRARQPSRARDPLRS